MKKWILLSIWLFLLTCCKSKQPMTQQEQATAALIEQAVEDHNLSITATWAYPLANNVLNQLAVNNGLGAGNSGSRINLIGNENFLNIHNDSVSAYLPYYGERRLGGGYNSSNGVEFSGIPKKYQVTTDQQKKRSEISFSISNNSETYEVFIELFANKKVQISVNSAHRTSIRYDGVLNLMSK